MLLLILLHGSGTTLRACLETNRKGFGFEINKEFYNKAINEMISDEIKQKYIGG